MLNHQKLPQKIAQKISRRDFVRTAAKTTAAAAVLTPAVQTASSYGRITGANGRIRLGVIGTANRGSQDIAAFRKLPDAEIAALCDVDKEILAQAASKFGNESTFICGDFRQIYEKQDIDAVVICTPDHWHAIQTVEACKAGKDVYVEKPLSATVYEGRKMIEAADKYKRVVQVGIHRRSGGIYQKLAAMNLDDFIGKVTVSRCSHTSNMYPDGIGRMKPEKPPEQLNWDLWLGPRQWQDYQGNIAPYKFRWWINYSSQIANNGVHFLDIFRQLLKEKAPSDVCAMGGNFAVNDDRTIPDTMHTTWLFPSGRLLEFSHYEANSNPLYAVSPAYVEFRGTKGTLYVNDGKYVVKPENPGQFQAKGERMKEIEETGGPGQDNLNLTELHARNFLDCIKSRAVPNTSVEEGHRSTTMSNIANISLAVGQRLKWDAETEKFIGNDEANAMLHYEYRKPWKLEV